MDLYSSHPWGATPPEEPDDGDESLLPRMTPLQFLVLWLLFGGPRSGRSLRTELDAWGAGMGRSAFSQMMTRLVAAGLVHSRFVVHDNFRRPTRFCLYQAREDALLTWRAARSFYVNLQEPRDAEASLLDETAEADEPDEDDELIDEFTNSLMADAHARRARAAQKRQQNAHRRPGRR